MKDNYLISLTLVSQKRATVTPQLGFTYSLPIQGTAHTFVSALRNL